MSASGPIIAGTGADGGGGVPWTTPENITANDGSFASASVSTAGALTSNEILATNFGFNIPAGATISGIQVDIIRRKV